MNCAIEGCAKVHEARGWCSTHYQHWRKTGSPVVVPHTPSACSQENCEARARTRGLCRMHYARLCRTGRPEGAPRLTLKQRLLQKTLVDEHGCWIWTSTTGLNGYGQIHVGNRMNYAHRVSYEVHVGPIPSGLQIDHLCRVRNCINPMHLEPVTGTENVRRAFRDHDRCPKGHDVGPMPVTGPRPRCRPCKQAADHARYNTKETV